MPSKIKFCKTCHKRIVKAVELGQVPQIHRYCPCNGIAIDGAVCYHEIVEKNVGRKLSKTNMEKFRRCVALQIAINNVSVEEQR